MKRFTWFFTFMIALVVIFTINNSSFAAVNGDCSNCHTMHNSQSGISVIGKAGDTNLGLTKGDCVGCHTGTNNDDSIHPFVYGGNTIPIYGTDTLAGGNFYWPTQDDAKGHNVLGIPDMAPDYELTIAPGEANRGTCTNSCHVTLYAPESGGVKLETGCVGCHLRPMHHAPQQPQGSPVDDKYGWFRFLSGHDTGAGKGVIGIEDEDWQYTESSSDHNEYLGFVGDHAGTGGMKINGNTMTGFCTGCHGDFHKQLYGNGIWMRHPSDSVIPNEREYAAMSRTFNPTTPVARPIESITDGGVSTDVTLGKDMVMCLSCHRAHGNPYSDMLRWDYTKTVKGEGCFYCHTEKD